MIIDQNLLKQDDGQPIPFKKSPNVGGLMQPEYLVIHYTEGSSPTGAIAWLTNPRSQVSAHLVIGRDGSITQLVPFNQVAWHAGASQWDGRIGLNEYSIGIELDNAGRLLPHGNSWLSPFGQEYEPDEVIQAAHKYDRTQTLYGWQIYPPAQMTVLLDVSLLLFEQYKLLDVVGHDDIAPGRKWDPGPAFPMDSLRAQLAGYEDTQPPRYETTLNLPIRSGPGSINKTIISTPLPTGTQVERLKYDGNWFFVHVLHPVNGIPDLEGWVYNRYVKRLIPV
jgi:N-acetylmuramoyl-L-alanine amidase